MSRVSAGAAPVCGGKPIGPADFGVERFSVAAVLDRRAEQFPDRVMMSIAGYRHSDLRTDAAAVLRGG